MPKFDVDYPHVRQHADIVAVLAHYNIALNGDGEQLKGLCPFHEEARPSFNVNVKKNVFKCHACGSGGNIIKLVQLLDPELENPRRAALQIAALSGIGAKPNGTSKPNGKVPETPVAATKLVETVSDEPVLEAAEPDGITHNRPLTFTLQLAPVVDGGESVVDSFVEKHGLSYDRLSELGIGVGQRGSMKDRLAIPVQNKDHEIVAYCGRDVGLLADETEPKYKFPPKFAKDFELYGWDVAQYFDRVVLVESLLSVIKHGGAASRHGDAGFGVASLMGSSISDRQIELLLEAGPQVIICFDGDASGLERAPQVAARIAASGLWVTVRNSTDGTKPDQDDIEAFCHAYGVD